VYEIHAEGNVY